MPDDDAPCAHCGAVLPLAALLRVDAEGGHVLLCQGCAVAVDTGREIRAGSAAGPR